jgi:hypothetical protein
MGVVLLQFIYDSSGVGRGIGAWLCVCLGTWHPYKQANTVVWCHWAARFIAPFFNHLVPKSNFRKKARPQGEHMLLFDLHSACCAKFRDAAARCHQGRKKNALQASYPGISSGSSRSVALRNSCGSLR